MVTEKKPTQTQGLVGGFLGGGLLGFLAGILASKPVAAAPPEDWVKYAITLWEGMLTALKRLVEIAEAYAPGAPELPPINIIAQMKPGMIFVPLDPEGLNGAIQAMRLKGQTTFPMSRVAWACPAGVTTNFTLTVPANFVDTRRYCRLTSDFYDPNVIVNIFVDDTLATPQGIALTGATTVDFGEFYVKTISIRIQTANGTATPAVVSLEIVPSLLEKSFYEEFYAPIMEYMYKSLLEVASGSL